ncbi:MAG: hypothetical protein KGO53_08050 [Alphaproteobacteria bacterium]|nr:hypothetical protein [Alphaproteobacteria bacterium]
MRLFLLIAGILACLFGAALLLVPQAFYQPTGIDMTPLIATLPQAHGATLFGLGVFNILARKADAAGLRAAFAGNLVVQVLSLVIVVRTMTLGPGMAVAPGVVIHVVLGSLCAWFLLQLRKPA